MASQYEELRKKYGIKANPGAATTSTGRAIDPETASPYDSLRRKYGLSENNYGYSGAIPDDASSTSESTYGESTEQGTFIPDLGRVWDEQDTLQEPSISDFRRRDAARRAMGESVKTEERLRDLGFQVPAVGEEDEPTGLMRVLKYPLNMLMQLQRGQFAVVGGLEGVLEGDASTAVNNFYRGLFLAEEHSVQDIINRYDATQSLAPWQKFALGLAGDIALDPLTWVTFGAYGIAKGSATAGIKSASELVPHLSRFGKKVLKEAMSTVSEEAAVHSVVQEIAQGSRLGKRLIPHGVRYVSWMPMIGGQRVVDPVMGTVERMLPRFLSPGNIIQQVDDISSSQSVMDQFTQALINSKTFDWLGKAFVPYWELQKKYPLLAELDRAYKARKGNEIFKAIQKGKELVKEVPAEDRKLIAELLDKPWLISGKKLATVKKTEAGIPELSVNLDYFPEPNSISSEDAEELVDFFFKVRREMENPSELLLSGQGNIGEVAGGPKFEALRPFFQSLIAHDPTAPAYQLKFDNFIVKIPRLGMAGDVGKHSPFSTFAVGSSMSEAYAAAKLNGSGNIADTLVTWRFAEEITGDVNAFPDVTITLDELDNSLQWAAVVGGHARNRQMGMFNGEVDEYARQLLKRGTIQTGDIPVPILVKRFIKDADTVQAFIDKTWARFPGQGGSAGRIDEATRAFGSVFRLIKELSRAGISPGDFHTNNVMLRGDNAIWVDMASFTDHIRGVEGIGAKAAGLGSAPKAGTAELVGMTERAVKGESILPQPGLPKFEAAAPPVKVPTGDKDWAAYLQAGAQEAYDAALRESSAMGIHRFGKQVSDSFSALFGISHRLLRSKQEVLKFAQKLKADGVITQYGERLDNSFSLGYGINVKFADNPNLPLIQLKRPAVAARSWEEVSEVVVAQHPNFAKLSPERQAAVVKAYGLTQRWKDEITHTIGNEKVFSASEGDVAAKLTAAAIDAAEKQNVSDFVSEVARVWGKPAATVVKTTGNKTKTVLGADNGWTLIPHESFKNVQVPEDVAKAITQYTKTFGRRDELGSQIWSTYDDVLDWWKGYATVINPGFHARNFFSNLFNLWLKDGPEALNPLTHKTAVSIMSGKDGFITTYAGEKIPYSKVLDYAKTYGVYNQGWIGDISSQLKAAQELRPGNWNPASRQFHGMRLGRNVGGKVENESRMVGFLNDFIRTGNPQWAAQNTEKYLFNYSEITDVVRYGAKRIFPFWVWMQKNMMLQASQIIRQPGKYGDVARFKSNMEANSPSADERWLPRYFPELYAMRTPFKTKEGSSLYLNPNLPFQDLNRVFDPDDWMASLAPWRAVFEAAANFNFFTKKEIEKYKGEVVEAGWLNVLPDSMMEKLDFLGIKKVVDPDSGRWFFGLPPRVKYAIEQAWPVARNWNKNIIDPLRQYAGEGSPEYQREAQPYNVASWLAGVKLMPYNVNAEIERRTFQRRDVLRDQERSLERQGKVPSYFLPDAEPKLPRSH